MGNTTHYHQRRTVQPDPLPATTAATCSSTTLEQIRSRRRMVRFFGIIPCTDGQAIHRQRPRSRQSSNTTNSRPRSQETIREYPTSNLTNSWMNYLKFVITNSYRGNQWSRREHRCENRNIYNILVRITNQPDKNFSFAVNNQMSSVSIKTHPVLNCISKAIRYHNTKNCIFINTSQAPIKFSVPSIFITNECHITNKVVQLCGVVAINSPSLVPITESWLDSTIPESACCCDW